MSKYNKNEDILSIVSNLPPNCCLKVDFQKVNQHAGGKWLIHDTKGKMCSCLIGKHSGRLLPMSVASYENEIIPKIWLTKFVPSS